jgi:catechol 2,3-dioxygenase-like lactoylglutathione lyase family enzyme
MTLKVVIIPVPDVERAAKFYASLGWRQDVTPPGSRLFQFTPGAGASMLTFRILSVTLQPVRGAVELAAARIPGSGNFTRNSLRVLRVSSARMERIVHWVISSRHYGNGRRLIHCLVLLASLVGGRRPLCSGGRPPDAVLRMRPESVVPRLDDVTSTGDLPDAERGGIPP